MRNAIVDGIRSGLINQDVIYNKILTNYKHEIFYLRPDLDDCEKAKTWEFITRK